MCMQINQNNTNYFLTLPIISFGITFNTLNLTVLDNGLYKFKLYKYTCIIRKQQYLLL